MRIVLIKFQRDPFLYLNSTQNLTCNVNWFLILIGISEMDSSTIQHIKKKTTLFMLILCFAYMLGYALRIRRKL